MNLFLEKKVRKNNYIMKTSAILKKAKQLNYVDINNSEIINQEFLKMIKFIVAKKT